MRRHLRRLFILLGLMPLLVVSVAFAYMLLMEHVEEAPRTFLQSLEWAGETLTSTGYGRDNSWDHPVLVIYVMLVQFLGIGMVFVVVGVYLVPFFEETFEGRLPRKLPTKLHDYVLVYRYGPAVSSLVERLREVGTTTIIFEEDESLARRLMDRGNRVLYGKLEDGEPDADVIGAAKALVLNGPDHDNGAVILSARQQGYAGDILALAEHPMHREPMVRGGATHVYTPQHMLAAALAARASERISPRVPGLAQLEGAVAVADLRVHANSDLVGQTLAGARVRDRTGVSVLGAWLGGEFLPNPPADARLEVGEILVIGGTPQAVENAAALGHLLPSEGPILVLGYGEVGRKLVQLLRDVGEDVCVLDKVDREGVDVVGDAMDRAALEQAKIMQARAVIVAVGSDAATLFVTSIVRSTAPDVRVIVRVDREYNVDRLRQVGADFALSLGQVAGQLIGHHLIGDEFLSLGPEHTMVAVTTAGLVGKNPRTDRIAAKTGCTIVAVRRGEKTIAVFDDAFVIEADDEVYVWGEPDVIRKHFER